MDVPLIDCDQKSRPAAQIAADIDKALAESGFMAVTNLGLSSAAIDRMFETSQRFFAMAASEKQRCAYGAAAENFGYQGLLEESLDPGKPADLKETFTMRNLLAAEIPDERWPDNAFREAVSGFYREMLAAAYRLQRFLAMALQVPADYFEACHGGENVTLRLLHYPPVEAAKTDDKQMGAGAHTDYGMLTLLLQDRVSGLQVQGDDGDWYHVPPRAGTVVINSGDLLERWSNGRYRSTRHRVLPRARTSNRYSIALFVDPDSATVVEALPSCVSETEGPRYPATTAGAHLQEKIEATHSA